MATTWEHPELGRFEYEHGFWTRTIEVPAFKAFAYDTGYRNARRSTGMHEVAFEAQGEDELPTDADLALLKLVLARQSELVPKVTRALWDDFHGRGPKSGMWWRNGLDEVTENSEGEDLPPLDGPEALLGWMQLSHIAVRDGDRRDEPPLVEVSFRAAFEREHGVGVLTDGHEILGLGYSYDVDPFDPSVQRKRDRPDLRDDGPTLFD